MVLTPCIQQCETLEVGQVLGDTPNMSLKWFAQGCKKLALLKSKSDIRLWKEEGSQSAHH